MRNRALGLKGQGATEYILLVAVIIVIAIVVASIVAFAGTGGIPDARKIQADAYWRSMRPLGIIDSTLNPDGTLSFILRNNEADPLNVNRFSLDDTQYGLALELGPGETATITVNRPTGDCEFDVSIDYAVGELDLQENGNMDYIVNCQSGGGQPEQGGQDCIGAGQASGGDCCFGLIYSNGYCRQESGVCTNNNQCLSANCGPDGLCSSQPEGTCDPRCRVGATTSVCADTLDGCAPDYAIENCVATVSCSAGEYTQCTGTCAIPCNADGGTCNSDSDCCGSNCGGVMANVCGEPAGGCREISETCDPNLPNGDCCPEVVCNPDGAGAYQCGDTGILLDNGQQCVIDSDCSSGICQFDSFQFGYNVCSSCRNEGGSCTNTPQCCPSSSGGASCESGTCVGCGIGDNSCIPGVPVGELGSSCCPGYLCSYYNHACIPDSQCLGEGDVCQGAQEGTCCSGYCDPNSGVCAAAPPQCFSNGITCAQDSECCSDYCDPGAGTCACGPIGNECSSNPQCCTSICDKSSVPNLCACIPDSQACGGVPANCCSGSCNGLTGLCEAAGKK